MANRDRARSPSPIPPITVVLSRAKSRVNATDSFAAIAERVSPVVWELPDFYKKVTSPSSELHAFISGDVRDILCYLGTGTCLLMSVHIQNQRVPIVWLRAQRRSYSSPDTIQYSADRSELREPFLGYPMVTTFATLNFRDVIDLLNNINLVPPTTASNSWWWSWLNFGMLHQGFGGSWVKPPSPHSLESTLSSFAHHATRVEFLQQEFAIQFPNAKKISLMDLERWKNEPTPLSQPTDLTLAGTKGKITRIGSALTLPEEHLRQPRPMQSPNVNGAVPTAAADTGKNGGELPQGREINHSNVLASKPVESTTPHNLHRRSITRTRNALSGQTDERRPVQPANPSSTPTPPTLMSLKEASTGIDVAMPILQGVMITAPAEALGAGPHASPPFPNPQVSPFETPNLTGRIVRLGSTPMARGGYSSVWRGSLISTTSNDSHQTLQVALKVLHVPYTNESTVKRKLHKHLHVELRIWARLHHENVVRLLGYTEEREGPGLVSISYVHGDVLSFLVKNPSVNREVICADVALGLQYLHEHKPQIIHGDLKGRNVLINGEGRGSICDFGLSVILDGEPTGHTSSNFGGTLRFLAPELLEESTRTVETDIYAYACACIEILFDQEPFHQLSKEAPLIRAISNHEPPFEPSNEEVTFPSVLRILKRCWDHDRSSRPPLNLIIDTIKRCLYHTSRTNLGIRKGIGRRVRLMSLPGVEQARLIWVDDDGLRILVESSTSLHRVPIYQRYRWELVDSQNLKDSDDGSDASSLSGNDAPSSESPPYVSQWTNYSVKFRLPYSLMVSYECYDKASS